MTFKNIQKLVLVSNDPSFLAKTTELASAIGLGVSSVNSIEGAMDAMQASSPDLLVADMALSGVEGLMRWSRSKGFHMPVIFAAEEQKLQESQKVAASDCCGHIMRKTVTLEDLPRALAAADAREHQRDCFAGRAHA